MSGRDTASRRDIAPELRTPQAVNVLFLSICPLILWFLRGSLADILAAILIGLLFLTARHHLIRGLIAEEVFERTKRVNANPRPDKLIGAGVLGIAITALAAYKLEALLQPIVFGLATGCLTVLIFGRDPDAPNLPTTGQDLNRKALTETAEVIGDRLQALRKHVDAIGASDASDMTSALHKTVLAEQRALQADSVQLDALNRISGISLQDALDAVAQFETDMATGAPAAASRDFVLVMTEILEDFEDETAHLTVSEGTREDAHVVHMLDRMDREFAA